MRSNGLQAARSLALLLPLTLILGALASQYLGGLHPCEMCHWQRWPHYAAIVLAGTSFFAPRTSARVTLVTLAAIAIAASGAIGMFHAGVEYGWWEGVTACAATVTPGSDNFLKAILNTPVIRCDVAQWTFLGISLAGFNAIFSLVGALAIFRLLAWRRG